MTDELNKSVITRQEILESLKREGVTTLDDFADKLAQGLDEKQIMNVLRSNRHVKLRQVTKEIVNDVILKEHPVLEKQPNLHMPVKVGKIIYESNEISQFDGKPLYFYLDENTKKEGVIYGFTNVKDFRSHLHNVGMLPKDIESDLDHQNILKHWVPGDPSYYYEHINYGGNILKIDPRHCIHDLSYFTMKGWWLWATSWDNQISSLKTGKYGAWLYEYPNFEGACLTVGPNTSISWIGQFWNDKISSIL